MGDVNNVILSGTVSIGKDYAVANTSASQQVYMKVNLTYTYGVAGTTMKKTTTNHLKNTTSSFDSGFKTGVSTRSNPIEDGYVMLNASAAHSCIVDGMHWSKSTFAEY